MKTWSLPSVSIIFVAMAIFVTHVVTDPCTMGQNRKKHRINSRLIIHCPTSEGVSEVSE